MNNILMHTPLRARSTRARSRLRGASLPEYAFLLVAILLVAAGAYRFLGRRVDNSANRTIAVLDSGAGGGTGAGGLGGALAGAAAGAVPSGGGVGQFFRDLVRGAVMGDATSDPNLATAVGQVLVGLTPLGIVGDIRDIGIAVGGIVQGREGALGDLAIAAVGVVPLGDALKPILRNSDEAIAAVRGADDAIQGTARNGDDASMAVVGAVRRSADDAAAGRRWADDMLGDTPNPRNSPEALARNAENREAYDRVMRGEMEPPPGVTRERLRNAVEGDPVTGQRIPLNFQSPEQFYRFQNELKEVLRKEGITDARIDQLGSATTGFKGNPNKPFGYYAPGSDADFAIYSDQMLDRARVAGAPVQPQYGIVRNTGGMNNTSAGQALRDFERKWNTEVYGRPDVDGFDFKVNLPRAPTAPGPDIPVIVPGG